MPEYFAEPDPATQEMSAAHARSYAVAAPHPQGAAAAERPPQIPLAPVKRVQAQFNPLADAMLYVVVFLGGMVGTALRYALSLAMPAPLGETGFLSAFHTATFIANMAACFIFATLTAYMAQASWIRKRVRQLASRGVGMGMCGGFSTLSAMVIEELTSIHGDQIGGFLFYMFASFTVGMLVAALGAWLATDLASHHAARLASAEIDERAAAASGGSAPTSHKAPKARRRGILSRRIADDLVVHIVDDSASVFVDVRSSTPPSGDYGQPLAGGSAGAHAVNVGGAGGIGHAVGEPTSLRTSDPSGSDVSMRPGSSDTVVAPSFEPAPTTDEIPMVGDPTTGDARESAGSNGAGRGRDRTGGADSDARDASARPGDAHGVRYFRGAHADERRWRR
ncbi:CrcB family protein [Bifidobacterium sp. MA2]|uniref:Fluoride-specific ion channel FluC n=1 Tax=Bifidobacterium santillanense TaxID=2809028 RepID=A0ABS5UP29_9BIFI|nr:CrcB family protein [Bifidobacterium santillanense]MBT1172689.1 CrcB family protein [Bifidobacterium santillanense]